MTVTTSSERARRMQYVAIVGTTGAAPAEALEEMNRDWPAYAARVEPLGVRICGRELDFPPTAVTVRVRDGETLVTDGPFAELHEYVGGFAVLDCTDLDQAIEVEGSSPVARFHPMEIRPFPDGVRLGPAVTAFEAGDDTAGCPYLFTVWDADSWRAGGVDVSGWRAWQDAREAEGTYVLGNRIGDAGTATTLRTRDGALEVSHGSFLPDGVSMAALDVVVCADHEAAVALAAQHPLAAEFAVEVRPFYSEAWSDPAR